MSALRRVGCIAIFLLATLLVPAGAPAAQSHDDQAVFIELHPGTVQPGDEIEIRASCGEDREPARIRSKVLDSVTLTPGSDGVLTATLTVSAEVEIGEYEVSLRCEGGARARAELTVLDMKRPSRGPEAGGGGAAGGGSAADAGPLLLAGFGALAACAGLFLYQRRRAS